MSVFVESSRKCRFGRQHTWLWGFWHEGQWVDEWCVCGTCGDHSYEGPHDSEDES